MTRPAEVVIDLAALQHNLQCVRKFAPASRVLAIVKADAYGHGLVRSARALSNADGFGVCCLEEAEKLRYAGIEHPIVLLEGPFSSTEITRISDLQLDIVLHDASQLEMLAAASIPYPLNIWIKIDSGMHRLGFEPAALATVWQQLRAADYATKTIRLMTHLALANNRTDPLTTVQVETFHEASAGLTAERSIANSAAILVWPDTHCDWVRPGLMLYGISPVDGTRAGDFGLRPVMTLRSSLIAVRALRQGEPVGYGAGWRCPRAMRVGVVAAGYGDGFPRHAGTGTPVLVNGRRCRTIGHASMDMLTVDLDGMPGARVGDPVELWGRDLPIEEVAGHAGTIPYELLCGVQKRLQFVEYG